MTAKGALKQASEYDDRVDEVARATGIEFKRVSKDGYRHESKHKGIHLDLTWTGERLSIVSPGVRTDAPANLCVEDIILLVKTRLDTLASRVR